MSDPCDGENRTEFCRICGKRGVNLRHLFNDEQLKREIFPKIHTVFPHILVSVELWQYRQLLYKVTQDTNIDSTSFYSPDIRK